LILHTKERQRTTVIDRRLYLGNTGYREGV
jgi:hypothetical protein